MYETGVTREQFAQIAVISRENAALNPNAIYRKPMTVDDYLDSKMISDPLCLFDCDVPVDGSVAFIVSKVGTTEGSRAVSIQSIGSATGVNQSCSMLWSRTKLRPSDLDFAQVYDGFSIYALLWIEALGLCEQNGAGALLEGGFRISRHGDIPINTNGGQLSGGRLHGFGAFHEACLQLRGEAGARQIPSMPTVGAVTSGAEHFSSALLLSAPT